MVEIKRKYRNIIFQCAWGGGALPFDSSSLNVPAAFSWYSKLDWSTLTAWGGHTETQAMHQMQSCSLIGSALSM